MGTRWPLPQAYTRHTTLSYPIWPSTSTVQVMVTALFEQRTFRTLAELAGTACRRDRRNRHHSDRNECSGNLMDMVFTPTEPLRRLTSLDCGSDVSQKWQLMKDPTHTSCDLRRG